MMAANYRLAVIFLQDIAVGLGMMNLLARRIKTTLNAN
jgi:hypothetical protein